MKISIVTPNYNGARFIQQTLDSVLAQRAQGVDLEYIVIDGASRDGSLEIIQGYGRKIDRVISEPDSGPVEAINKGFALASGDLVAWLNADDVYTPGALQRAGAAMAAHPRRALYFGRCRIVNEQGFEIRRGITRFKESFYPFACRFMIQTINFVSQPAVFFQREALQAAGPLRDDLKAAFDYDLILRTWRQGGAGCIAGPPLAHFRWHPGSISGRGYKNQFREELEAARRDAGRWAPQVWIHELVRLGIVWSYDRMAARQAEHSRARDQSSASTGRRRS